MYFLFILAICQAFVVQASASLQNGKLPWWEFETICQNIRVPRSPGVQQNKNSGTRAESQTVDTTTNEGSKTMGRGFLERTVLPYILGGMQRGRKQGLCFPVLSPQSRHLTAVVIRGVCRSLISLWQWNQSHPRDHMVWFIASCVHLTLFLLGQQPVICVSIGLTCYDIHL